MIHLGPNKYEKEILHLWHSLCAEYDAQKQCLVPIWNWKETYERLYSFSSCFFASFKMCTAHVDLNCLTIVTVDWNNSGKSVKIHHKHRNTQRLEWFKVFEPNYILKPYVLIRFECSVMGIFWSLLVEEIS